MGEKELFNFGDKELDLNSLLNNITSNQQSYLDYYSTSISDSNAFIEKLNYLKEGIKNGTITTDGTGIYYDKLGKLSKEDELMNNALHYIDTIAREQSKQTRSLTRSEIEEKQRKKREQLKAQELRNEPDNTKPEFTPPDNWSIAKAFAYSFNQNGQIPYDLLQQLVTQDDNGNSVYTDLHAQLDKNFDLVSKQLQQFNNTKSYIDNINLFKQALKDGDLSPQDKFLGMELGFQTNELDKLNNLIKYKVKPIELEIPTSEDEETHTEELPKLEQDVLERDDDYKKRVDTLKQKNQKNKDFASDVLKTVNFDLFDSPKSLKADSEDEFKKHLLDYINTALIKSKNPKFVRKRMVRGLGEYHEVNELWNKFKEDQIQYIDPELYNKLGLKFFSKYSKTNMYKHFSDLVDKQNKKTIKNKSGGVLKAQNGMQTPWRLNFDGQTHNMDDIYQKFIKNVSKYDSKQIANSFNKLNGDSYKSLNFEDKDNTLGFKDWNTTFNASGLNDLFGYNENKSDYLGPTTKSRQAFIAYLKNKGSITTGNGTLSWNPESNQWEYSDWADPNNILDKASDVSTDIETTENGSQSNVKVPEVADLTLKEFNLRKAPNFNPNGILNSIVGYVANEAANDKKREIQKQIPIYQKVTSPEKAFKTAYTYDLEKSKNELEAEAHNIQPMTSDINAFYSARNEAIKNARAYTTKIDTEINNRVHEVNNANADIAYENAVNRTETANENAKNRHTWTVEQLQGQADFVQAANASFQNLNKKIEHTLVTAANKAQAKRDTYVNTHVLAGLKINPSNYIDGWTKHHDLIWYKGQNGELETDAERAEYQQLLAVVNQASSSLFSQYEDIHYPGMDVLHVNKYFKQDYNPSKHGNTAVRGKHGAKIDKQKIGNFIKKLK